MESTVVDCPPVQQSVQPPPLYESALEAPTTDSPPSYESLSTINKLKKAKEESSNPIEFMSNACAIICGSFIITLIFAISIAIPITMIIIGTRYLDQCEIQKNIPIWLIVTGAFGCLSSLIRTATNCFTFIKKRSGENTTDQNSKLSKKSCLTGLIELFLFIWFIIGNVWVYSISNMVSYDPTNTDNYCHKTCYLFAFWMITLSWIMTGVFCFCCCCVLCVAGCGIGLAQTAK